MAPIYRFRGDSAADLIHFKQEDGTPFDVSLATFLMTVNTLRAPNALNPGIILFAVPGVVVDGPLGIVSFTPTTAQTNVAPGKHWYDVQMTLLGLVETVMLDTYVITQDISK